MIKRCIFTVLFSLVLLSSQAFAFDMSKMVQSPNMKENSQSLTLASAYGMFSKSVDKIDGATALLKDKAQIMPAVKIIKQNIMPAHKGISELEKLAPTSKDPKSLTDALTLARGGVMKMMDGFGKVKVNPTEGATILMEASKDLTKARDMMKSLI